MSGGLSLSPPPQTPDLPVDAGARYLFQRLIVAKAPKVVTESEPGWQMTALGPQGWAETASHVRGKPSRREECLGPAASPHMRQRQMARTDSRRMAATGLEDPVAPPQAMGRAKGRGLQENILLDTSQGCPRSPNEGQKSLEGSGGLLPVGQI